MGESAVKFQKRLRCSVKRGCIVRILVARHRGHRVLDGVYGLDAAARAVRHAVHRRCRTGKIELPLQWPILEQSVDETGMENISCTGGVDHWNPIGGAVQQ